jgi:hypothetical protein
VSPDGTTNADKLVEFNGLANQSFEQTITLVAGTSYAISVYAKAAERIQFRLAGRISGSWSVFPSARIDLSNGTVLNSTGDRTATVQSVGNGWYRCTIFGTATATNAGVIVSPLLTGGTTSTYTGDGTSGIYLWGAQNEAGLFSTSYIPTVASQVTRAPDNATMTGANFLSWYNQSEGTLFPEFVMEGVKSTGAQRILQVDDGTDTNRIGLFLTSANQPQTTVNIAVGNSGNVTIATPVVVAGAQVMAAVAYKINDFNLGYNGAVGTTDTSVDIPLTLTTLRFAATIAAAQSNVWFQRLTFYPRRLTNVELQGITS